MNRPQVRNTWKTKFTSFAHLPIIHLTPAKWNQVFSYPRNLIQGQNIAHNSYIQVHTEEAPGTDENENVRPEVHRLLSKYRT